MGVEDDLKERDMSAQFVQGRAFIQRVQQLL
jgi:hypothetical protein